MNTPPAPAPDPTNLLTLILSNQAKLMAMGNTLAFQLARMESAISGRDLGECVGDLDQAYREELAKCQRAIFEGFDVLSAPPRREEN